MNLFAIALLPAYAGIFSIDIKKPAYAGSAVIFHCLLLHCQFNSIKNYEL